MWIVVCFTHWRRLRWDEIVFTTVQIGRRPSMPVCPRTSAFSLVTLEFLFSMWRRLVLRSSTATYHILSIRVLQKNVPFICVINPFTALGTGPDIASRFGSIFDVHVSRKNSMSSAMSQRMVWVDLEASHRAKTRLKLCSLLNARVTVCILSNVS